MGGGGGGHAVACWGVGGRGGGRLLPLLLRLIKTAPTFLLNHPTSQRTKHFYQCLYLGKQWQVGCQGPPWPCYRRAALLGASAGPLAGTLKCCHFCASTSDAKEHTRVDGMETNADAYARRHMKHFFSPSFSRSLSHTRRRRHTLLPLGVVWWLRCDPRGPRVTDRTLVVRAETRAGFPHTHTNKIIIFMHFQLGSERGNVAATVLRRKYGCHII